MSRVSSVDGLGEPADHRLWGLDLILEAHVFPERRAHAGDYLGQSIVQRVTGTVVVTAASSRCPSR